MNLKWNLAKLDRMMRNKFLYVIIGVFLIAHMPTLVPLSAVAAEGANTDIFKPAKSFGILAKRGQNLSFLRTSLLSYVFQWGFVFTINRGLSKDIRSSNFKRWVKNIKTLPQIPDGDHWITNYIGHPLLGASIYAFYRNRGFSNRQSIAGTFLQSTLFEYTVEGWKKPPSGVDLIVTPMVGSFIGYKVGMNSFLLSSSYAISKYLLRLF